MEIEETADRLESEKQARRKEILENTASLLALRHGNEAELRRLFAQHYVKRGKRFLNRHAPLGWWRNFLDVGRCRVDLRRNETTPLALAFEYDPAMTDEFGYVQDFIVKRKLGLQLGHPHSVRRLGFSDGILSTGIEPFPKRAPKVVITTKLLNQAWAELVQNPDGEMLCHYRHRPTRWMATFEKDLWIKRRKPTLIERLLGRASESALV
ncbi:MAG TPA: hypothetical protein VHO23_02310 [Candidatus Paceibacterota bacterium]|nr:hypothetical protein [Candidatus Paceibacterota bacterium]